MLWRKWTGPGYPLSQQRVAGTVVGSLFRTIGRSSPSQQCWEGASHVMTRGCKAVTSLVCQRQKWMPGADALKACVLEGPHRPLWSVLRDSREAGFGIWGLKVKGVSNSLPPRASGFFLQGRWVTSSTSWWSAGSLPRSPWQASRGSSWTAFSSHPPSCHCSSLSWTSWRLVSSTHAR